jgi:uridylate kinase
MKKRPIVISLGGSMIIPDKPNYAFLKKFKSVLKKHYSKHKFVIVAGGGVIARKYITKLKKDHKPSKELSKAGIMATRMNAKFLMQLFGKKLANDQLPKNMKQIKSALAKNKVVICGALRYTSNSTSDTTAAKLANYLNSEFINLTNIAGLYSANPKTNKKAKFISEISWKEFEKIALSLPHKDGQHFVLDQNASTIIRKNKIPTYIIGPNHSNLNKLLEKKKFIGTIING